MRNINKSIAIVFALFVMTICSKAQSRLGFQYGMAIPSGDLKDFISKTSFRGFSIDYKYMVKDNIGIGCDLGWNVFYQNRPYGTYTEGTMSLTGVQYRYTNVGWGYVTGHYYFLSETNLMPYVGVGIGTLYADRDLDMGLYYISQDDWQFAYRPEIGLLYKVDRVGVKANLKYQGATNSHDLKGQNYWAIGLGMEFDLD